MLMVYIEIFLKKTSYAQLNQVSINLFDMGATYQPELEVLSSGSYHQWWSIEATLIISDLSDLNLAPVLSCTDLPTSN